MRIIQYSLIFSCKVEWLWGKHFKSIAVYCLWLLFFMDRLSYWWGNWTFEKESNLFQIIQFEISGTLYRPWRLEITTEFFFFSSLYVITRINEPVSYKTYSTVFCPWKAFNECQLLKLWNSEPITWNLMNVGALLLNPHQYQRVCNLPS